MTRSQQQKLQTQEEVEDVKSEQQGFNSTVIIKLLRIKHAINAPTM